MPPLSRRQFLALTAATAAGASAYVASTRPLRASPTIPGRIIGPSAAIGHRLRDGFSFPAPSREIETTVAVVGGGVAGLAAARELTKRGVADITLLELEEQVGGTAASGRNEVSAYPWGAHYVPAANPESREVIALFEELGIITGRALDKAPIYEETMLCADPAERLFIVGRWQEGLVPQYGITPEDRAQYDAFFHEMERWRGTVGSDGAPAFAIPLDLSSRDPDLLALDQVTMDHWMDAHGYHAAPLRWYVNYCCRDDYGAGSDQISAWAGLHYFASRRGWAANAPRESVVTWPEGNGWLVHRLREQIDAIVHRQALVFRMEERAGRVEIDYYDWAAAQTMRLRARTAVCALPRFIARRVVPALASEPAPVYSPWMVANVTLDTLPEGRGEPLAWDNVFYQSKSLGYVTATHQDLFPYPQRTVLTLYWPLDDRAPAEARQQALTRTHAEWCEEIVADLSRAHPGLREHITHIDICLWGHGMIRPIPGYLWGGPRQGSANSLGAIHFAHSDLSGMALFEEAYTRGLHAAGSALLSLA